METDLKKLWENTLNIIKGEMSEVSFNTWIKSCEPISISSNTIKISVPLSASSLFLLYKSSFRKMFYIGANLHKIAVTSKLSYVFITFRFYFLQFAGSYKCKF